MNAGWRLVKVIRRRHQREKKDGGDNALECCRLLLNERVVLNRIVAGSRGQAIASSTMMAPQNGRYDAVKMLAIVHQTYGEWVTADFPHEDPMQAYRRKVHMSVVVPVKE